MLLTAGNTKVGKIGTFNLPAVSTCPGASALCKKMCYAQKGHWLLDSVQQGLRIRYEKTKSPHFISAMCMECLDYDMVRWHSSGDIYSPEYANKLYMIARELPNKKFCTYTRSWTQREFRKSLDRLNSLPNFQLFLSLDETMQEKPLDGFRIAYLNKQWKRPENSFRCPNLASHKRPTCSQCKLCFREPGKFRDVEFCKH